MDMLPYLFAAITLAGVLYFLYSLFFSGDSSDLADGASENNFTLLVGAAFASVFGAVGLLGTLSGWNFLLTLVVAIGLGVAIGYAVLLLLRFVMRQQSAQVERRDGLIGTSGRVSIESAAGMIGEAMIDGKTIDKYAIKEVNDTALHRGDVVEVVDVDASVLYVKKKRS
ncbi:MAG: hypothetical protein KF716_34045 [Anaerolineae bacterium]|nr:hypothetical protein [Anaerolineae bacterium]